MIIINMEILTDIRPVITVQDAVDFVQSPECGGVAVFAGTVRNETHGKKVTRLFFDCYAPMALQEMEKIARHTITEMGVKKIAILHVSGDKLPGETVVVIAAAASHRDAAFAACRYAIDTLKEAVPIWKKEYFEDGEVWVAAHP